MMQIVQATKQSKAGALNSSAFANGSVRDPEQFKKARTSQAGAVQTLECLSILLRLLVFKRPGLALLEVGGTSDSRQAILNAVNRNARYSDVDGFISVTKAGEMKSILGNANDVAGAEGNVIDWDQPIEEQKVIANSIDIFIINSLPDTCSLEALLQNARTALRQRAWMIITGKAFKDLEQDKLHTELSSRRSMSKLIILEAQIALARTSEGYETQSTSGKVATLWLVHERSEDFLQEI